MIYINFVVELPRTQKGRDFIGIIVDRLTKSTNFLLVRTTYDAIR